MPPAENDAPDLDLAPEPQMPSSPKPSMIGRVNVLLILGAIIGIECIIAYLVMPTPDDVTPSVAAEEGEETDPMMEEPGPDDADFAPDVPGTPQENQVEVQVGDDFRLNFPRARANTNIRVSFQLFAVINEEDEVEFNELYEARKNRIRGDIDTIIRNSDMEDLSDPFLGLIKRKILERVNRRLGKRMVEQVEILGYSFTEQ